MSGRGERTTAVAGLVALVGYLVVAALVASGDLQPVDDSVRRLFRPRDAWGPAQVRTGPLIDALEPRRVLALFLVVALAAGWRRRSWRPVFLAVVLTAAASALTLATKYALHRPDPHADVYAGGSFPSGHMVSDLVGLGGIALLLPRRTRWWSWALVGLVELAMGAALLFAAAHWFTDVAAGFLLGVAALVGASRLADRGDHASLGGGPHRPR